MGDSINFELLLKKNTARRPSALYNKSIIVKTPTIKPQDVLDSVYSQIKTIQMAEGRPSKVSGNDLKTVKKSHFMSVTKLPVYTEVPKPSNSFETQCVSDTQLIDIIEDAEALINMHKGMTQEFESTFAHNGDNTSSHDKMERDHNRLDTSEFETTFSQTNVDKTVVTVRSEIDGNCQFNERDHTQADELESIKDVLYLKDVDTLREICDKVLKENKTAAINALPSVTPFQKKHSKEVISNHINVLIYNKHKTTENIIVEAKNPNDSIQIDNIEEERSPSPVLMIKSKINLTKTPSPLVVSLESFEKFERLALPLIYSNDDDIDTCIHLINSQILKGELCFNTSEDIMFNEYTLSPIIEMRSEIVQLNAEKSIDNLKEREKRSESLKDEILFSSDEESDYVHRQFQNMPLTAALETSFYDHSNVLEETMYVGFKTASNKSIQIHTDSFQKARCMFDENDNVSSTNVSLSNLVEICDEKNFINMSCTDVKVQEKVNSNVKAEEVKSVVNKDDSKEKSVMTQVKFKEKELNEDQDNIEDSKIKVHTLTDYNDTAKKPPEKQSFVGFKTASNKEIDLSDIALDLCKKVFMDIDFDEKFDLEDQDNLGLFEGTNVITKENNITNLGKNSPENDIDDKIKDDLIIQEFENIEMSLVEKKTSCVDNTVTSKFKTASNSNIDISDEAKVEIRDIFQNIDLKKFNEKSEELDLENNKNAHIRQQHSDEITERKFPPEATMFIGFKTANNKNIKISAHALSKTKSIFQDIDNEVNKPVHNFTLKHDNIKTLENLNQPSTSKAFVSFKSVNDKDVKITEIVMSQSYKKIKDIDNEKPTELEYKVDVQNKLFYGFRTANKKNIKISEQALYKSKKIFQEIDRNAENTVYITKNSEENVSFSGFKSANSKAVTILEKDIVKSKKLFEEIDNESQPKVHSNTFVGFQTASKKPVKISALAIEKSKKIFQEIDDFETVSKINVFPENKSKGTANNNDIVVTKEPSDTNEKLYDEFQTDKPRSPFIGFKTASNKNVNISEEALTKGKKIFDDFDEPTEIEIKCKDIPKIPFVFQTTNNKKVEILKEAIEKAKDIFDDIEIPEMKDPSSFMGFQTASKKKVNVSEEALEKTKALFNDIDIPGMKEPSSFMGFQTASKKKVEVSEEALKKTKTLFNDIDILEMKEPSSFMGFQTASKKKVEVSEEALEKTKALFNDYDIPEIKEQGTFKNIQTASKKKVKVSKEAMEKTKALFNDIDIPEMKDPSSFMGIQTASKKKVKVSEEALEKTKGLFNDIDILEMKDPSLFMGFQTASKKKVEVSKEALEKTKALFNDNDIPEIKEQGTFKGFQTASKKKVDLSKEAIEKTKTLFNDIEDPEFIFGFQKVTNKVDNIKKSDKIEVKQPVKRIFSCQTSNNININVSQDALKKSRKLLEDAKNTDSKSSINKALEKDLKLDTAVNLDNIINTQVLNNFEEDLCTEDFKKETPRKIKRSGSPILFCPRAKKRKRFETPFKETNEKIIDDIKTTDNNTKNTINIKFNDNYKKNKIYTLKDLTKFADNEAKIIDPYISNFNIDNILNFEFEVQRNKLTDTKMDIHELKNMFLNAVNKNLVPEGWLDNHLKLIIWKLLSYEVKFPNLSLVCTVQNVIDQLKYRYDKELYNAERPALRKIFERDDVSTKTMVLCVAGVYIDGVSVSSVTTTENIELLLTDGWYFMKATIDKMLSKLVYDGRIIVGCKMVTSGAELINCEQGIAPWEDTSSVRLKLSGNSTRPAPWDTKLGYTRAAILNSLSSVRVEGGKVTRLCVFVSRVYPLLYVEKFDDGSTVTRSERLEHLHQMKYEAERELMMERICEEVQREFSDQEFQDSETQGSSKRKCYESGSQIAKMMKRSRDPMEFRAQLTSSQVQLLEHHTCKYRDRVLEAIHRRVLDEAVNRNVIALARGRIADVKHGTEITKAMLSIWKPNEAVLELFREGAWIEIMNVVPTAIRYSEIQITAGRQSVFKPTKHIYELPSLLQSVKRKCYKISDVAQNSSLATDYNEIDTVGIVFQIEPNNREFESNKNFQNVYLADADKNIIGLNFWGGIKKFGFENILDTGQIVACANLQKRAGNTRKNIPQFRVTEFTCFTKTPNNVQAREMVDDINRTLNGLDRRKFCDDCIAIKNNYTAIRCLNNFENESPYGFNKGSYSFTRNKMFIDTPLGVKPNKSEDANLNLTGLDFESTFKQETQELSPRTLLRKKKVNEKIEKLKRYGEPPPITPINIINKSENVKSSYKSPLLANNSIAAPNNVASVAVTNKLPEDSPTLEVRSPVISMKRSYVRSVTVKLNFADKNINNDDPFAEEFDGSPPLSLE